MHNAPEAKAQQDQPRRYGPIRQERGAEEAVCQEGEEMIVTDVYVVTCTPRNGAPSYTYGVFTHEDYAIEHSRVHGDKDADFLTRRESLMESSQDDLRMIEAS